MLVIIPSHTGQLPGAWRCAVGVGWLVLPRKLDDTVKICTAEEGKG